MIEDLFKDGRSIKFLQKKCREILVGHLGKEPNFLFAKNFTWSDDDPIQDVVLMGDALLLITDQFLWPRTGNFRYWVLSQGHRDLLQSMFPLEKKHIGVIPRDFIYPAKPQINPWPDFTKPSTFILSSRLLEDKNIDLTLHLAHELQRKFPKMEIGVFTPTEKLKPLKLLIANFTWKKKPKIYGDRGFNWHKSVKLPQPFLVNLSTYPMEDFNVSVAQARERGWPLILSHWGVFREIKGPSVSRVSAQEIFEYGEAKSAKEKSRIVSQVVGSLLEDFADQENVPVPSAKPLEIEVPKPLAAKKLLSLQTHWNPEKRKLLISALMEPEERSRNPLFLQIKRILS